MKIALGTAQFGMKYGVSNTSGQVSIQEAASILELAAIFGVNTLDTAISYGDCEAILGKLGINSWRVITKLPMIPNNCENVSAWVVQQVSLSLQRMGVEKLYCIMLHRPEELLSERGKELYETLLHLKNEGLCKKIGYSIYGPLELEAIYKHYSFDLIQAPINILDRRLIDTGWAKILKESGVELHARSVFLQGLLLMSNEDRPEKFGRWEEIWNVWDSWLISTDLSPVEACLRYVNNIDYIDKIVVGVVSACQFQQIIQALQGQLHSLPNFGDLDGVELLNPKCWDDL